MVMGELEQDAEVLVIGSGPGGVCLFKGCIP
jgi:hypothetical protein